MLYYNYKNNYMLFHRSHRRHLIFIGLGIVLIATGLYYYNQKINLLQRKINELQTQLLKTASTSTVSTTTDQATESYNNTTYHYRLLYPKNFNLKIYSEERAMITDRDVKGNEESDNGKVNIIVVESKTTAEKKMILEDFIFNTTKNVCNTEGGGIVVTCPRKKNLTPLIIPSGLTTYALTLERQEKTFGPEASTLIDEATFFAIDLSTEKQQAILIIYPIGDGTVELAKKITETISRDK